jgi:hypothetical protein
MITIAACRNLDYYISIYVPYVRYVVKIIVIITLHINLFSVFTLLCPS